MKSLVFHPSKWSQVSHWLAIDLVTLELEPQIHHTLWSDDLALGNPKRLSVALGAVAETDKGSEPASGPAKAHREIRRRWFLKTGYPILYRIIIIFPNRMAIHGYPVFSYMFINTFIQFNPHVYIPETNEDEWRGGILMLANPPRCRQWWCESRFNSCWPLGWTQRLCRGGHSVSWEPKAETAWMVGLNGGLTSANCWFLWGKKRALMERIGISLLEMEIFHSKHGW